MQSEQPIRPEQTTPPSRPVKKSNPISFICIILIVAIIGLVGYIVYDNISGTESVKCKTEQQSDNPQTNNDAAAIETELQSIAEDSATAIGNYYNIDAGWIPIKFNYRFVPYEFEENSVTALEKSYTVSITYDIVDELGYEMGDIKLDTTIGNVLVQHGLKKKDNDILWGGAEQNSYYENDDGYMCYYSIYSEPFDLICGHTSWLSEEKKALIRELMTVAKKHDDFKDLKYIYIDANLDDIEDAPVKPYQRIQVSLTDAAGFFYRTSSNSDWQFLAGTQSSIPCKTFDNNDKRKAFQDFTCYDFDSQIQKKVSEL